MAQYSLNPDRCQRTTVSGRTITSAFFHWDQNRRATTQKSLSMAPSLGRGCWRLKTASCWRRARFSSIRQRRVRNPRSTAPSQSRNRSNMATKIIADRLCRLPCEVVDFTAGQDCDEGQINTDLAPIYSSAIRDTKKEGTLRNRCRHRPVQYLNNILEQDHRAIKRRVNDKQGFREF